MIKIGPSGNSERAKIEGVTSTEQAAKWVKQNQLDCFEYSFGRGVNISKEKAISIGKAFKAEEIEISVHAPYFINLATPDDEKAVNSFNYITTSADALKDFCGKRIVFHPASVGKETREVSFLRTKERFLRLTEIIYSLGFDNLLFCPETMGKINQIGTVSEIIELCQTDKIYIPTLDFGHINARGQGVLKTKNDFINVLEECIDGLGMEKMKHFHCHFSKIQYTKMGEVKHLTFADDIYGPEFEPLAEALIQLKLEPYIVSESAGTQGDDAITMKKIYNSLIK